MSGEWKEYGFLAFQVDVKSQKAHIGWSSLCRNLKPLHLHIHVKYFHLTCILCGYSLRSFDLWWSLNWIRAHLHCELWLWILSCHFPFFFFYLNASSVMQFKRGRCLQINKVKATIQAFNNEFCRLMLLLLGFPEWVSLKWALLSCFCLLSLSVLRIMSNIIPRGSEEIWRRLVWCNTLSYIWVTENSNIIWFMSQIACWAWESRNGNCLCRESELQHAGY